MNDRLVVLEEGNSRCVCHEGSTLAQGQPKSSNNQASTSRTIRGNERPSTPIGATPNSASPTISPNGVQVPWKGQNCRILSWYNEGEVVVDATINETDPKKTIHNIPICFGAYSVWYVLVLKMLFSIGRH